MRFFHRDASAMLQALDRSQAVIAFKLDGTILTANANYLAVVGYTLDEIRGRNHSLFVDPDEREGAAYRAFWRSLANGEHRASEYRRLAKGGREVWLQATYTPILDRSRHVTRIVKFATDITRDVEERRQFQVLSLVANETDNSVVITDADGAIEYVNAGFTRMTGYGVAEAIGRKPGALLQGPDTSAATRAGIRASLALRQPFSEEVLNYTKAGEPYRISLSINPIFDEGGALRRFVSIQADVTKRKAAEDQLARRNEELHCARMRADAANDAKSRFLAVMSHELRTPMTGVIGLSDLMLSDDVNPLAPPVRHRVEQLRPSADQLLGLLNDILDLSKIEAGELTVERIGFDPVESVRQVVGLLAPLAQANGNRLEFLADDAPRWLLGDPTRIRQVLFNVVGNANKFTRDGCIRIAMRYGTPSLDGTEADLPNGDGAAMPALRITVRDDGIGMTAEQVAALYQPFVQGDVSTVRRYGGTGLGLAISKRLVAAMGGDIAVETAPGAGTSVSFSVAAPLGPANAQADTPRSQRSLGELRPCRILLAEDTDIAREIVATMLRRAGHTVVEVRDGAQAVDAARAASFDLVLMDMQMPVMDGPTATRAIRALPGTAGRIPILALTADALPEHRNRHVSSGLDGYVTKPVDWTDLADAIHRCRTDRAAAAASDAWGRVRRQA